MFVGWMDGSMNGWMGGWVDRWMDQWMDELMNGWVHERLTLSGFQRQNWNHCFMAIRWLWWTAFKDGPQQSYLLVFPSVCIPLPLSVAILDDSLLMSRIQQTWWDVTSVRRLQRTVGFCLPGLSLLLTTVTGCHSGEASVSALGQQSMRS